MHSATPSRRLRPSPAAYALAATDATIADLADALGVTRSAASLYLAGHRGLPGHVPAVLADLIGEEAASVVLAAIPQHKPEGASVAPS